MNQRKYIKINKLFGKYDNEIDLSSRGIIFIGENGVGKTTIMKILKNLMNLNFAELVKYDFESIDMEVIAKNGKIIKDTINYADLLPKDEEIKKIIINSDFFSDDLRCEWETFAEFTSDEEKISAWNDSSMTDEEKISAWNDFDFDIAYDYCNSGDFNFSSNDVLNDLINKNELKNIIKKIIKDEEFTNLYYDNYINGLNQKENKWYEVGSGSWDYGTIKKTIKNIINTLKESIDKILLSNKEIDFDSKKKISRMVKLIIDGIDKPIDILDMTKVYNFGNELLMNSLITNKLLEWKASAPVYYDHNFSYDLDKAVYNDIYKQIQDDEFGYGYNDDFEDKSKTISELNNPNIIDINSVINHYYYNEGFVLDINKKALKYYIEYNNEAAFKNITNKEMAKTREIFIKYIKPIILRNSPFDCDWYNITNVFDNKYADFCMKEYQFIKDNINPKMITLQELLNKYMLNKEVEVTPMGLLIKSKGDNQNIPLNSLSSGEKKLLVIFMHCLFNEDVPIIIDEPEISLSIIWQENLLPDLLEKTNIKKVIVATHSSAVISDSSLDKYIIPLPNSVVDKGGNKNE